MGITQWLASGTRAVVPARQGLLVPTQSGIAGNQSVTYSTPGMPETPTWDARTAVEQGYFNNKYVMRGPGVIARALGSVPFRAGADPDKPGDWNKDAPLAKLLGPAPYGPNPSTTARRLMVWTIIQHIVTGRYAWELELNPAGSPVGLWPLVSAYVQPIPSGAGSGPHWSGYRYNLPTGYRDLPASRVHYGWNPSQRDWWQPESPLESVALEIGLSTLIRRYNLGLVKNGLVASKMIVHPIFEDASDEAAWRAQFISNQTGPENAGRPIFSPVETEPDPGSHTPYRPQGNASVQVIDLAQNATDAGLQAMLVAADEAILDALGVPMSIASDASGETFDNASQDASRFWRGPVLDMARELQDDINLTLAPRLGSDVGWFDFSKVEAFRPSRVFAQIAPDNAVNAGLAVTEDWRNDVGLPPLEGDQLAAAQAAQQAAQNIPVEEDQPSAGAQPAPAAGGRTVDDVLDEFGDRLAELSDDELRSGGADVIELRNIA